MTLAVANFDIDSTVHAGTAPNTRGQIECRMSGMSEYVSDKISDRMFLKMPEYMQDICIFFYQISRRSETMSHRCQIECQLAGITRRQVIFIYQTNEQHINIQFDTVLLRHFYAVTNIMQNMLKPSQTVHQRNLRRPSNFLLFWHHVETWNAIRSVRLGSLSPLFLQARNLRLARSGMSKYLLMFTYFDYDRI